MVTPFNSVTTPYNDVSAVAGTTYNYWVVGVNSCGTSANSSLRHGGALVGPRGSDRRVGHSGLHGQLHLLDQLSDGHEPQRPARDILRLRGHPV